MIEREENSPQRHRGRREEDIFGKKEEKRFVTDEAKINMDRTEEFSHR
jgi:hypothetical protein